MKKVLSLLSLLVVAMFLVGCAPTDEEVAADIESMSDEDLEAAMVDEEDSGAIAGQAYMNKPNVRSVKKALSKKSSSYKKSCQELGDTVKYTITNTKTGSVVKSSEVPVMQCKSISKTQGALFKSYCKKQSSASELVEKCESGCADKFSCEGAELTNEMPEKTLPTTIEAEAGCVSGEICEYPSKSTPSGVCINNKCYQCTSTDSPNTKNINCPSGYTCDNGNCVGAEATTKSGSLDINVETEEEAEATAESEAEAGSGSSGGW